MNNTVAVYGTLLSEARNQGVIAPFAIETRPIHFRGVLYHTGYGFPVVLLGDEGEVLGELVTLSDPERAFDVLDRFEGASQNPHALYRRVTIEARLTDADDSDSMETQVYAVNPRRLADIPGLVRVEDGDWLSFIRDRNRP